MTTEAGGEVAIDTTKAAPEAALSSQETTHEEPAVDHEARAREMGWVPEAEWKGDKKPAKFLSAEEFVDRGETIIPLLKAQIARKDEDFAKRFERLEKMNEKTRKAAEAAHADEIKHIRAEMRTAAARGDTATYDALETKRDNLEANPPSKEANDPQTEHDDVQAKWIAENDWYTKDEELAAFAFGLSNQLAATNPKQPFAENLQQVTAKVKARFPEKFGAKPTGHAAVDSGALGGGPARDPLSSLPAEARSQAKKDMAQFPKVYPNAAAWLKAYNS